MPRRAFGLLLLVACSASLASAADSQQPIDFGRQIQPILTKHCVGCHGPDAEHREADLRLDQRDSALASLPSGKTPIVPGKAAHSELFRRVTTSAADERMPPSDTGPALSPEQIELLRRWIEAGAPFAQHWAWQKPRRPVLPSVREKGWPRNGIDTLVLAQLEREGLTPAPEATRHALIRRLSLDLRGLPPTPAEVAVFLDDDGPGAYERLVDRFLADPAYGERWARVWLDLARYADSKGYGSDPLRVIWRYRDWVIDALNRNMTFDQFTIEQLAGDLLPKPLPEQLMATAFHRNTMTNTEGGTDDEEFRVEAIKDRVDTTFQVWMAVTLGCAKCHNHKYDPFSQREYYQAYAIFNQTADADRGDDSPLLDVPTREIAAEVARLDPLIAQLKRELAVSNEPLQLAQLAWERKLAVSDDWQPLDLIAAASSAGAKLERQADGRLLVSGGKVGPDSYTLTFETSLADVTALRLEVLPDKSLPAGGAGRGRTGDFTLARIGVELEPPTVADKKPERQGLRLARASADFSRAGTNVANLVKPAGNHGTGWSVVPEQTKPHAAVLAFDRPLAGSERKRLVVTLDHVYKDLFQALGSFRITATKSTQAIARGELPRDVLAALDKPADKRSPAERDKLAAHYRSIAPELAPQRKRLAALEKSRPKIPTLPIMSELPKERRRITRILAKGSFLSPGEEVQPGLPASMPPLPTSVAADRLALARWLVSEDNPLTARVFVNRVWSQLFGIGFVTTEGDFGTQGAPPSYPELLDWLATEFMRVGWDQKALLRTIVTSATYRQSAAVTPELIARDPDNRLLARGPRFRLEAEMVRDQALALSGLLSRKMHGPSVFPPQPDGLWQAAFNGERTWATSSGEDRYRRGLYVYWRRTVPYPSMATFDAPSRELCTVKRSRTNTPLQALVTMNDPVYVEAAQALARRIIREGGTTSDERARFGLGLCLVRPPVAAEIDAVRKLVESELVRYRQDTAAAQRLATEPLGALPAGLDPAEAAAWTIAAGVLLNLDGVLTKG